MENEAAERLGICCRRISVISPNGEWRMRLQSDWESVAGVFRLFRLFRQTENGEWRMENEAEERLGIYAWRNSVISPNGEWRMENEAVEQQLSILHSPFYSPHLAFSHSRTCTSFALLPGS